MTIIRSEPTRKNRFGAPDKLVLKRKKAWKEFKDWLKTTQYEFVISKIYLLTDRTLFRCKACKTQKEFHLFTMRRYKNRPPECSVCKLKNKRENFVKSIPKDYKFVKFTESRVELKHECGRIKSYAVRSFSEGTTYCDCLKNKTTHTDTSYKRDVARINPDFTLVSPNYINGKTLLKFKHSGGCGKSFERRASALLSPNVKCPKCYIQSNVLTTDKCQDRLDNLYGKNVYKLLGERTTGEKIKLLHAICGKTCKVSLRRVTREHYTGDPCYHCFPTRSVRIAYIKGRQFRVRGTEEKTLHYLLEKYDITAHDIRHGNKVPKIPYRFNGKDHNYLPDFWIPKLNIIVESKDHNTFGLSEQFFGDSTLYERNRAKAKSVLSSGFRFKMVVHTCKSRVKLPKNWYNLGKKALTKKLDENA